MEDIVGDAIRALRIGEARSARAFLYGSWGLRWGPSDGVGFTVYVVSSGDAWLLPEGSTPTSLGPGDVVFVSRAVPHGVADARTTPLVDVPTDERNYWFPSRPDPSADVDLPLTVLIGGSYVLDRDRMHPLLESLPPVIVLPSRALGDDPIRLIVDLLAAEHDSDSPGTSAAIPALLDLLLAYVVRAVVETADPGHGWAGAVRDRAMARALANMQNRPEVDWTVESLARASDMSRATFARRFTALIGRPPLRYLTWWRMALAAQLLTDSDLPISAIAQRVGYSSEFAFGKAFAREVGVAPGAHRRRHVARRRPAIARR